MIRVLAEFSNYPTAMAALGWRMVSAAPRGHGRCCSKASKPETRKGDGCEMPSLGRGQYSGYQSSWLVDPRNWTL
jgi:hypothetical protein